MSSSEFRPDREVYIRDHIVMASLAMGGAMLVLWLTGNPHVWTGAVAGLGAIAFRGWFMASEELSRVWTLDTRQLSSGPVSIPRTQIEAARPILSAVQVITCAGDKHLIKFQKDPAATAAAITGAAP